MKVKLDYREFFKITSMVFFILGTICLIFGYHNIDWSHNLLYIRAKNLSEVSIAGKEFGIQEVYGNGVRTSFLGYFLLLIAFIILLIAEGIKEGVE